MSWYRQYRPQTVGSLHIAPVREAFLRVLTSGEFSHAYLLAGPKGTGKTSGARILAKVLNCEGNRKVIEAYILKKNGSKAKEGSPLHEPCNTCATCVAITNGSSLCVSEMDGASNRGIDDIRLLTERIGLSAADGAVSVVIIDEVHMLTTEAFNALLKMLEEPPAHVVFILATTDPQKMPATVVSRCTLIPYRKATSQELISSLENIAAKEGIKVGEGVFDALVSYADGSFRDGVKVFEQVAKGKTLVEVAHVEVILGKSQHEVAERLVQALAKKDYKTMVEIFKKFEEDGSDIVGMQKGVLQALYTRMVAAPTTNNPHFPTYVALLKALNTPLSPLLPIPSLPFEIACLEWCMEKGNSVSRAGNSGRPSGGGNENVKSSKHMKAEATMQTSQTLDITEGKKKSLMSDDVTREETSLSVASQILTSAEEGEHLTVDFATLLDQWHVVLQKVREQNASVEALLRTTTPKEMHDNTLVLEVGYAFHKEQLESVRCLPLIEEVFVRLFATRVRVQFSVAQKHAAAVQLPKTNVSGFVDLAFVKAAEDAFLS